MITKAESSIRAYEFLRSLLEKEERHFGEVQNLRSPDLDTIYVQDFIYYRDLIAFKNQIEKNINEMNGVDYTHVMLMVNEIVSRQKGLLFRVLEKQGIPTIKPEEYSN
jgi:tyrosine-protein phosphatase YwqE